MYSIILWRRPSKVAKNTDNFHFQTKENSKEKQNSNRFISLGATSNVEQLVVLHFVLKYVYYI